MFLKCTTGPENNPFTEVWKYRAGSDVYRPLLQQKTNPLSFSSVLGQRMVLSTRYWFVPLNVADEATSNSDLRDMQCAVDSLPEKSRPVRRPYLVGSWTIAIS